MPRSPADNQQLKDARREAILRAATRVFAKKGFSGTKISDMANEAGLSHGLVYHYFANKEAVFTAILEDKLCRSRKVMDEDESLPGTSLDRMRSSIGQWLERVRVEPDMSLVVTQALMNDTLTPETRAMLMRQLREGYENVTLRIARGQAKGEIGTHAPAAELASALMCFMRGLAFQSMVDYGVTYQAPSVDTFVRMMIPNEMIGALAMTGPRVVRAARTARPARGTSPSKPAARGERARAKTKKTERKAPPR